MCTQHYINFRLSLCGCVLLPCWTVLLLSHQDQTLSWHMYRTNSLTVLASQALHKWTPYLIPLQQCGLPGYLSVPCFHLSWRLSTNPGQVTSNTHLLSFSNCIFTCLRLHRLQCSSIQTSFSCPVKDLLWDLWKTTCQHLENSIVHLVQLRTSCPLRKISWAANHHVLAHLTWFANTTASENAAVSCPLTHETGASPHRQ